VHVPRQTTLSIEGKAQKLMKIQAKTQELFALSQSTIA
jgi:hypothetical protein